MELGDRRRWPRWDLRSWKTGVLERAKDQGMILARMGGDNNKKMGESWKEIRERELVREERGE